MQTGLALPRVAAGFEFKRPLRFDDEVDIRIEVASIGRSSIGYRCTLSLDGDLIATGTMTVVCASGPPGQMVPVPVPDAIRDALSV